MQLLDAVWTPKINMVVIECDCGFMFQRRADMWKVVCPRCGKPTRVGFTFLTDGTKQRACKKCREILEK